MAQPVMPDYSVGDTVVVQQSDGTPKTAKIMEVAVSTERATDDPNRVRYLCRWGDRITQWDWFYAPEVRTPEDEVAAVAHRGTVRG